MAAGDDATPLGGSMADAETAMRRGKGGLLTMAALAVALLGGLALVMGGGDEARVYRDLGKRINGLKQASFDQFWGCALQGADLRDVKTNADLSFHLDARARERGRAYGLHVRQRCLGILADVEPQLDALIVPDDLREDVTAMKQSVADLRSAVSGFVTYLDDPELSYDSERAKPLLTDIARAWYEFKKAHGAVNKTLRAHLEQ